MKKIILIFLLLVPYIIIANDNLPKQNANNSRKWAKYDAGEVNFRDRSPESDGSKIYKSLIPDPDKYITEAAKKVLSTLYFSPKDSIPAVKTINYVLRDYDGVSGKSGAPPAVKIEYSTRWIERAFNGKDTTKFHNETLGVLYHELTHAYQLEPQGIGSYGTNKTFWAFIEGMADAVRYVNGGFTLDDKPKGGNYMSGYRTTGFFLAWIAETKDKDFLKKFNLSTLEVIPWSFDGAIKHVLGNKYSVDSLWEEYSTI